MTHLANILIATDDLDLTRLLVERVHSFGYEGKAVTSQSAALEIAGSAHPDIVLVGSSLQGGDAFSLVAALKQIPSCVDIPVCLLAAERSVELHRRALEAGLDDVVPPPLDDYKLAARLRPLVRLATMHAELRHRAVSAKRFGIDVDPALPFVAIPSDYPLMIVGEDTNHLRAPLSEARITVAPEPYTAEDLLTSSNFDAAVLAPSGSIDPYLDLCAQVRNNPRLFNLPLVVVSDDETMSEATAYGNGASAYFSNPPNPDELKNSVLGLVRRQRTRWAIRQALSRTMSDANRDKGTNLYSRAFFDAYLSDRVEQSTRQHRHLSLMFFRIPDIEGVRQRFGETQANHLRLQCAQWITGLLRGEDMTARFDENEFCVVLPDTPKNEAEIVMHRIAGVLAYTDFAVVDVYQPVKVWVRVGGADIQPGDSVESLVARAREGIV